MARTAINPTTGQRVQFDESTGQWVPIASDQPAQPDAAPSTFGERAGAAFKMTPAGKRNFLVETFGQDNVFELPGGSFLFRRDKGEKPQIFDPPSFESGDFADMAGGALEVLPGVATAVATTTANPVIIGAADAAGNAIRQGVSALLPGSDEMSANDRLKSTAITGGMGAAMQGGSNVLFRTADAARPSNIAGTVVRRNAQSKAARRGAEMNRAVEGALTPGQELDSRMLLAFEAVARQHPISADAVHRVDRRGVNSAWRQLRRGINRLSDLDEQATGRAVQDAYFGAVRDAVRFRSRTAARDFAQVDAGGVPNLRIDNLKRRANELLEETEIVGPAPPERRHLQRLVDELEAVDTVTGRNFQNTMARYGRSANGSGDIFKELDKAQQTRYGRELLQALERDLDDNVARVGLEDASDAAQALRQARDNYRTNSGSIEELRMGALGRILGGTPDKFDPEQIVAKVIDLKSPSRQREAMVWLDAQAPDVAGGIRAQFIESLMTKAQPAQVGAGFHPLSPRKFASALNKEKDKFAAIFTGHRSARRHILMLHGALSRMGDKALQGSQTTPLAWAKETMEQLWHAAGHTLHHPVQAASSAAGIGLGLFTPRRVAQAMADPQGRRALMTITRTGPVTRSSAAAVGTLLALWGIDQPSDEQLALRRETSGGMANPGN